MTSQLNDFFMPPEIKIGMGQLMKKKFRKWLLNDPSKKQFALNKSNIIRARNMQSFCCSSSDDDNNKKYFDGSQQGKNSQDNLDFEIEDIESLQ